MSLNAYEFDKSYEERGKDVLDRIFGEFAPARERVRLTRPRTAREVVFAVEYDAPEQFSRALSCLCEWLAAGEGFESLEKLMLY